MLIRMCEAIREAEMKVMEATQIFYVVYLDND